MRSWLTNPSHRRWLDRHAGELLHFARRTGDVRGGAHWLGVDGTPDADRPTHTYITSRMAHVFGIGALLGIPGAAAVAQRAMAGLTGRLHDDTGGGWYPTVSGDGPGEPIKSCYDHAFVLLAASTVVEAGCPGADALLERAQDVFLSRFWDSAAGLCSDTWDTTFTTLDGYRGANANMHAVEAMLSVASVTGDPAWIERARGVCAFFVKAAQAHQWRIPEHYDESWRPQLEMNRDQPAHPFKPFGATVGHALEWARLLLHTEAACAPADNGWLVEAAVQLFDRAVTDGWDVDGNPGFVYTTDWAGAPVVRDRLHWVVAEGINAAAALHQRTGDATYSTWYQLWWDYAEQYLIDHRHPGSWIHQLDPRNQPADSVWAGKPDTYHAFQATLVPRLPGYPMIATAVARGHLA